VSTRLTLCLVYFAQIAARQAWPTKKSQTQLKTRTRTHTDTWSYKHSSIHRHTDTTMEVQKKTWFQLPTDRLVAKNKSPWVSESTHPWPTWLLNVVWWSLFCDVICWRFSKCFCSLQLWHYPGLWMLWYVEHVSYNIFIGIQTIITGARFTKFLTIHRRIISTLS